MLGLRSPSFDPTSRCRGSDIRCRVSGVRCWCFRLRQNVFRGRPLYLHIWTFPDQIRPN